MKLLLLPHLELTNSSFKKKRIPMLNLRDIDAAGLQMYQKSLFIGPRGINSPHTCRNIRANFYYLMV